MTDEQEKISWENKQKAREYFIEKGIIPADAGKYSYDLHHIDPSWRHDDIERYIQWNPDDLVVMTHSEHARLHAFARGFGKGEMSDETKKKISDAKRGVPSNRKDFHHTEETKKQISDAHTGKKLSEEHKQHISEAIKGKSKPPFSEEHRRKLSEAAKRRWSKECFQSI